MKNIPRGTESITEKSKGRDSIKGKLGCGTRPGLCLMRAGTNRLYNVQNNSDEMLKKNRAHISHTPFQVEEVWGHRKS